MPESELDYESPRKPADAEWLGPIACVIGAAATVLPVLSLYPMLTVAKGTSIRPMEQALWIFLGAAAGVAIVLPMAAVSIGVSIRKRRSVRWGVWGLVAAFLSIVAPFGVFTLILKIRGLTLGD